MNELPKMNIETLETNCCPKFQPELFDGKTFQFKNLNFVKAQTKSFLYIPLNMGKIMTKTFAEITKNDASPKDKYLILSLDVSPWKCEHYFLTTKPVESLEMTNLDGTYIAKVFEGKFGELPKWIKQMKEILEEQGKTAKKVYAFYTTCPKCAKYYGKNYVVLFAEI